MTLKKLIILLFLAQIINAQSNFPDWAKGIVWYQIFPERFANGDTNNDPKPDKIFPDGRAPKNWKITPWTSDWFGQSQWEKALEGKFRDHVNQRRYGGDIQGIINHLDYLKNLGVKGIYLNPVFDAVSLHKYDGSTYHHIDINFGPDPEGDKKLIASETPDDPKTWKWTSADKLFLKLVREIHKRDMRIIIDGVFNHVGTQFWAFRDLVKNQQNSRFKDWFQVISFDDPATAKNEFDYKGWWNAKSLPQFNRTKEDLNPGPKQYIFNATKRWMDPKGDGSYANGIDGWRLDVARDVPLGFWKDWSKLVKSLNPNSIIVAELWELSPDFISATGPFDALMNYPFAFAVNKYFIAQKKKISTTDFINLLQDILKTYPEKNQDVLQNLVDSHDTERLSSMINNPDREYDRDGGEGNPDYDPGKPQRNDYNKQKLIAAFQMTYKGSPMIYYGDEVGMWGADDPHDRNPMVWDNLKYDDEVITAVSGFHTGFGNFKVEQNKNVLDFYKKIISIHNKNSALRDGDVQFVYSNNKTSVFAFERSDNNEKVVTAFNTGLFKAYFIIPMGEKEFGWQELLSGDKGTSEKIGKSSAGLKISILPGSVKIFKITSKN
jgi:cyclomaltodextrinase / maltogenic alpha-amylase / neopullulanase